MKGLLCIVPAMKRFLSPTSLFLICVIFLGGIAYAATESAKPKAGDKQEMQIAKAITTITGVAISPLLGVGAVGFLDWLHAKTPDQKAKLPWYAHMSFWLPALLLVGAVGLKDAAGTVLPPGLKKPLDVAETIENKVSGLVAAGAFVPFIASIFHAGTTSAGMPGHLGTASILAADFTPVLNILSIPLFVVAFVFVWLVGHVINVLILVSPFGVVDTALKSVRIGVLGLLVIVHKLDPWLAAGISLLIIVISYFVAGWSFRLMVYGSVFTWDFISGKRHRFTPAPNANWMFLARKTERAPVRSYGKLIKTEAGKLTFTYRPWLILPPRTVNLPEGQYAVGRGLFYPEILLVDGEKTKALLTMPPRYKKHEEEIGRLYGIADVCDTGLLKGIRAIWRWFTRNLFGGESREAAAVAT